jgi:hypothetical protein
MDEAMTSEMSQPNPIAEYKTEYGGTIGVPNFVPSMNPEVLFFGRNCCLYLV